MAYLETQRGLPPGEYSPSFLELDKKSGPWLTQQQQTARILGEGTSRWDLDAEKGQIRFGDGETVRLVARIELLGTYAPEDGTWLWSWANPKVEDQSQGAARVRDEHESIAELSTPTFTCTETKAWSVAAAAAFLLEAETCCRLPGEPVQTFVALFGIHAPEDEAPVPEADPEAALEALEAFAGPMALNLGGLLLDALKEEALDMDEVIALLHQFGDNLMELGQSPLGQGTPAAAEAQELALGLRQGALMLSVPPGSPMLREAAGEVLALLKDMALRYGAWPGGPEDRGEEE